MHCANTGAMLGCEFPGKPVHFSTHDNPKRKYVHSLEIVEDPNGHLIGVNTGLANRVVGEVLQEESFTALAGQIFQPEIQVPDEAGRFDFGNAETFVEVKSATYLRDGWGVFPDATSERASRHANALTRQVQDGKRGVLIFCVMHNGINRVSIAKDIDHVYFESVERAMDVGVEIYALKFTVTPTEITFSSQIDFELSP